jgi:hypothetical protein
MFKKLKNSVPFFSNNAVDDAKLELESTRRELLKFNTVVENYSAQVSACTTRIARLEAFLANESKPAVSNEQ